MFRPDYLGLVAACLFVGIPALDAHGRADSAQNYAKGMPDSAITIDVAGGRAQWRVAELARLPRTSVVGVISNGKAVQTFSGIPVAGVWPTSVPHSEVYLYEVHYGFFRKRRLLGADLDPAMDVLITEDKNDGFTNRLTGIRVIAKMSDGRALVIKNVYRISMRLAKGPA